MAESPLKFAQRMLGKGEVPDQATIQEYLTNGGMNLDPKTTAWCAAFVNSTLAQTGFQGTGKLNARSFLDYGTPVDQPQPGDVAVFTRGDPNGWQGHVGFFDSYTPDGKIRILAGNQGNKVDYGTMDPQSLLGFRRPLPKDPLANPVTAVQQAGIPAGQNSVQGVTLNSVPTPVGPTVDAAAQLQPPTTPAPDAGLMGKLSSPGFASAAGKIAGAFQPKQQDSSAHQITPSGIGNDGQQAAIAAAASSMMPLLMQNRMKKGLTLGSI